MVAKLKIHLSLNVPYPFSARKEFVFGRGGTAWFRKEEVQEREDSLADGAPDAEGKIGICPVACEKSSIF